MSEGIPLEQGLRQEIVAIVLYTLPSEGIPLEQGLRLVVLSINCSDTDESEGIPLEQGLRHLLV